MDTEKDPKELVTIAPLGLTDYSGRRDDMQLETCQVSGGTTAMAVSTDDEEAEATFGAAGKIFAHKDGTGEILADGIVMITFANRRLFGLFVGGTGLGNSLGLNSSGSGSTVAFTFPRDLFNEVEPQRGGFGNKVRNVILFGGPFGIALDAATQMDTDGSSVKARNDELLAWSEAWVAQAQES